MVLRKSSDRASGRDLATAKQKTSRAGASDAGGYSSSQDLPIPHQAKSENLVNLVLATLSPNPERSLSRGSDLRMMKSVVTSVHQAMEEDILSESEANALIEFLVARFIERRFGLILQKVFDAESARTYTFRGIRGEAR